MTGREVAGYPLRITRSKTAIMPVKSKLLPRRQREREHCRHTVYVSNLDKQVERQELTQWSTKSAGATLAGSLALADV